MLRQISHILDLKSGVPSIFWGFSLKKLHIYFELKLNKFM